MSPPLELRLVLEHPNPGKFSVVPNLPGAHGSHFSPEGRAVVMIPPLRGGYSKFLGIAIDRIEFSHARIIEIREGSRAVLRLSPEEVQSLPSNPDGYRRVVVEDGKA